MCNTQEKQEKHQAPQGKAAFFEKKAKTKNKGQFADKRQEKKKNAGKRQEKSGKDHAGADQGREIRTADQSGQSCTSATRHADPGTALTSKAAELESRHPNREGEQMQKREQDTKSILQAVETLNDAGRQELIKYLYVLSFQDQYKAGGKSKSRPQFEVIEGGRSGERPARDKAPRQQDPGREGKT